MISCRELIEFLDDYLEGSLDDARRAAFEEHLAVCPDCVHYLASYRASVAAARAAFTDPDSAPPDEVPEDLITAILNARGKS